MHVIILGAGITGVTAAYVLGSRGHTVEVIEREDAPAMQTSFANGGQLSYTHAQPWANPDALPKVIKWMFQEDAPLVLKFSSDPHMIRWGLRFLFNCNSKQAEKSTRIMLRLGLYSRQKLADIRAQTNIEYNHLSQGILHIFGSQAGLDSALKQAKLQESLGGREELLTPEQCFAREPALKDATKKIAGGLYSDLDESGDLHVFTQKLAAYCIDQFGARFHYNTHIYGLSSDRTQLRGVETSLGMKTADAYVMALGSYSPLLLRPIGIDVPIYPMKGYSVTVPAWQGAPTVSITDDEKKIVISRLGDKIRAAGTAEFARYNSEVREKRITPILRCISDLFPAAQLGQVSRWACLRPQTPDGPPIIGATSYPNLFMHTGHGTLGWTQSAGSAHLLADIMEGRPTEISLEGLETSRYRS
ncbi:MAG: D-amino acid dehydrogenase [Rickettsiales bacterium]|nr:D-amino acid dehydrogenase [Rickettsiales bacterium]